jgi:hypothetical protein
MTNKGKVIAIIMLFISLFSAGVLAGPPYTTDDPEPVEYRHWEIYLFGQYVKNIQSINAIAPGIEVNYGILPEMQIHFIFPAGFSGSLYPNLSYQYGSTEIGVKYRFIRETDFMPQAGTFPHFDIAAGKIAAGTFSGETQFFIPLWLQKTWGPFTSYGGGGYWINPGAGNMDWWFLGWVLQYAVLDNAAVGIEINYNTPQGTGMPYDNSANIGAIVDLSKNNHVMLSLGTSMIGREVYLGYAAYQLTFGPEAK